MSYTLYVAEHWNPVEGLTWSSVCDWLNAQIKKPTRCISGYRYDNVSVTHVQKDTRTPTWNGGEFQVFYANADGKGFKNQMVKLKRYYILVNGKCANKPGTGWISRSAGKNTMTYQQQPRETPILAWNSDGWPGNNDWNRIMDDLFTIISSNEFMREGSIPLANK